ncbi:MAG: hypothetical protein VX589_02680 [Myxococcota bacterium]|nr:hypothetical protein [Myxococcota bacterium]
MTQWTPRKKPIRKPVTDDLVARLDLTSGQLYESATSNLDRLPDVRDGLTREQRVILHALHEAQKERPGKAVPTMMLYGRVASQISMSQNRFKALLAHLVGRGSPGD